MATTVKVVDASALACFCFDEPEMADVAQQLVGCTLFAPALLDFEIGNICWKRLRKDPARSDAILAQFAIRREFPITVRPVVMEEVVALAAQTALTAYDASYLWLARTLGAGLVTLDGKLARAASRVLSSPTSPP